MPKRRQKGSGGLYQRHDHEACPPLVDGERPDHKCRGRWVGTVEVMVDGKRRRKVVYGRTEKEARIKQAAAKRARDTGALVLHEMTCEAWFAYWLDHIAKRKLKPQTLRGYRSKVALYIVPELGRRRLTDLRPEHLRRLYDGLRDRGLSESTTRQTHAIIKKALRDAMRDGKLTVNPADLVDPPGTATATRQALTVDQARRVLASTDDARWWLALFYGMRQGEALGLRWSDVDLERHTLTINQTLQTDETYTIIFGPPKSKASRRTLPLLPLVEARLKLHEATVGDHEPDALVFTRAGHPVQPKADWLAWRDLLTAAGVPHVALHAARNTAASLLEAAGVPDRLVMQILGHSQVQITHGYQSADDTRLRQALTAYAGLLELPSG